MASQHLKKQIQKLQADHQALHIISSKLISITSNCYHQLKPVRQKLAPLICSLIKKLNTDPVEDHIRQSRISAIKHQKAVLESKLDQINKSIEQGLAEEHRFQRPNLQFEKIRHEYFKEEQEKSKQNALKVREYHLEQLRRQKKIEKHLKLINQDLEGEKEKRAESEREKMQMFEEKYSKEIKKMKDRSKKRRKYLEAVQSRNMQISDLLQEKPLFQKIEERYIEQIEMRELDRRKEELARKRLNFQPLNKSDLLDHAKKHDALLKESKKRSLSTLPESQTYNSKSILEVLRRDNERREEEEKVLREKLQRVENKKIYGQAVRDLYAPAVDKFKQMEILLRMEKLKNPVVKKKITLEGSTAQSESEIKFVRKVKKSEEKKEEVREEKKKQVDYLALCRAKRNASEIPRVEDDSFESDDQENGDQVDRLRKKAERLDFKAKRAELTVNVSSRNVKDIENCQKVDNLIISAIKAKLGALKLVKNY
jgi:hypothetical protein